MGDRYTSAAAVRGGALLLQRVAPELLPGYARYYLTAARRTIGSDPVASLAIAFPLPAAIRDAILASVRAFAPVQRDDITLLILKAEA